MHRNINRMSTDAILMLSLTVLLSFCVEQARMQPDNGTGTSELSHEFSIFNTPPMADSSSTSVAPGSTTTDLPNTEVTPSSTIPALIYTTTTPLETKADELTKAQVTPSPTSTASFSSRSMTTEWKLSTSSSMDTEAASASGSAPGILWENNNVTDGTLTKITTVSAAGFSSTTILSNESYDVIVDNETTVFPYMDNATDYKNDTNVTSLDDWTQLEYTMTSQMTQPPEGITTMEPAVSMDTSKAPESSSSSMSSSSSSQSSLPFSEETPPPPPHQPQSQPQETTVAANIALAFGVIVGVSCVIVVAIVSVRQCLGHWARRDYSNLDQDNISFS